MSESTSSCSQEGDNLPCDSQKHRVTRGRKRPTRARSTHRAWNTTCTTGASTTRKNMQLRSLHGLPSRKTTGIGLWTTTGIRHLRRTATAGPPQFKGTVKPQASVVDSNRHVTGVSENCNCDHTWEAARPAQQGHDLLVHVLQLGKNHGLLIIKTMGICLCTTTGKIGPVEQVHRAPCPATGISFVRQTVWTIGKPRHLDGDVDDLVDEQHKPGHLSLHTTGV